MQSAYFQATVSVSVVVTILLLILVVFVSFYCLRCRKQSNSDDNKLLVHVDETDLSQAPQRVQHDGGIRPTEETQTAEVRDSVDLESEIENDEWQTTEAKVIDTMQATVDCARALREKPQKLRKKDALSARAPPILTLEYSQQTSEVLQVENPLATIAINPCTEWLSTQNFKEVLNTVWSARLNWYILGVQLGLQVVQLNVIKRNHHDNADECIMDMIQTWLHQEGATWKELITALKHESVGFSQEANSIAASLNLEQESTTEIETSASSTTLSPVFLTVIGNEPEIDPLYSESDTADLITSSFDYLDTSKLTNKESRRLKARLRNDTKRIITHFSDLVIHMRRSFKRRNIDPQDLVTTVNGIARREPSTQSLQKSLRLQAVTSIDVFVNQLQDDNYISFINYHLVQYMIIHYGTEEDKTMFAKYLTEFQAYCRRSVFEVPQDVFGSIPSDGEKLAFKVRKEVVNCLPSSHTQMESDTIFDSASDTPTTKESSKNLRLSLGDVIFIQERIAETLNLDVGNLILLGACRGCVELTFSAPKVVMKKIETQYVDSGPDISELESQGIHILSGPPSKPQAIKLRNLCYRLHWKKPKYHGPHPIRHYKISYRPVHNPLKLWKSFETKGPTESIVMPDDLHSQHESSFVFIVQAVTDIGIGIDSEESDSVLLQTSSTRDTPNRHKFLRSLSFPAAHDNLDYLLTSDNLQEIMNKLNPVREQWYEIGLKLGVNVTTLDEIKKKYKISNICLRHMLGNWLTQRDATREALISALKKVGLYDQSISIATKDKMSKSTTVAIMSKSDS